MYCVKNPTFHQYIIVTVASCTFLHVGMYSAWPSPLLVQLKNTNQTVLPEIITDSQAAWLASLSILVGMTALLYTGFLADTIGRKYTMVLGSVPRILNCIIFLTVTDVKMLLFGRSLTGLSDVICSSVTPIYVSEIASKEIRGGLGTIGQIMSALGSMLVLCIGPFLSFKALTTLNMCTTIVTFIPMLFLPQSPFFLYSKGRENAARKVLTLIRNQNGIDEELNEYCLNINNKVKVNRLKLLKNINVLKTCFKVCLIALAWQTTGYIAVTYYLQTIFELAHTTVPSDISSLIIGCIHVFACGVAFLVTDKFGRKPIFTTCLLGIGVGMVGLGTFFKLKENQQEFEGFLNYLPLISAVLVIGFNAGICAVIYTLFTELFEGATRALGVSIGVLVLCVSSFLIARFFGALEPANVYIIFAACCVASFFFILLFVPETKGKTFSEIQKDMEYSN